MRTIQPLFIFSADRQDKGTVQTLLDRDHARDALRRLGLTFTQCQGHWDGDEELSFAVHLPVPAVRKDLDNLEFLCGLFNQDAYLLVSGFGSADLVTLSRQTGGGWKTETTHLGQWRAARSQDEVDASVGWTRSHETGVTYVVV